MDGKIKKTKALHYDIIDNILPNKKSLNYIGETLEKYPVMVLVTTPKHLTCLLQRTRSFAKNTS
jgi:hypothetical protein